MGGGGEQERDTDRQTDRQTDIQRQRLRDRQTETDRVIRSLRHSVVVSWLHTHTYTYRHTHTHTHTNTHTHTHTHARTHARTHTHTSLFYIPPPPSKMEKLERQDKYLSLLLHQCKGRHLCVNGALDAELAKRQDVR